MIEENKYFKFNENKIEYSIIIPIFNQENIIINNLKSIINNTIGNFEIILILDFCFDNTEKNIIDFFNNNKYFNEYLTQIKIFKNIDKPLFETKCDNIGFKNSSGRYCLEIQADMEMIELGYNLHLTKPFILLNNVIAVSGRCAHNLFTVGGIGKIDADIEKSIDLLNIDKNKFYVYETCNRGPLLLDRKKLEELNYLDEDEYYLDNSDHDLMARAYIYKKYICGYVPINFNSPLNNGSIRNNNFYSCDEYLINKIEKLKLKIYTKSKPGLLKYINIWKNKNVEIYNI